MSLVSARIACAFTALALVAQPLRAADISEGLTADSVSSWTEADGRPLGSVYAIAQALDGYLWIGSDAGLFRFDGWRFVHWDSMGDTPLPKAPVTAVSVARDGSIWVGLAASVGLIQLRDRKVVPVAKGTLQLEFVDAIEQDQNAVLWAVSRGGLYHRAAEGWRRVRIAPSEPEEFSQVVNLRASKDGGVFVLTTHGVFRQTEDGIFTRITGSSRITAPQLDAWTWDLAEGTEDGSLWTTDMAVGFKRRAAGSDSWSQPQNRVMGYRLVRDRRGAVWVGTIGEGLWRVVPGLRDEEWAIERITLNTGLTSNSVRSMIEDRDGNIWVGTTAGLHRLSSRKLTPIGDIGLAISVEAMPGGEMLVGTSSGFVTFRRGAQSQLQRQSMGPGVWAIRTHLDRRGMLWVGSTDGGFTVVDGRLVPVPELRSRSVRFIASDALGRVWFGDGGRVFRTEAGRVVPFDIPPTWGISSVMNMFDDHAGRLWLVAPNGLGLLDVDGRFRKFGLEHGLRAGLVVNTIFEDRHRTLWLGTDGGLGKLDGERFVFVGLSNGLPSDRVGAVVDDDDGHLWLNIDTGLVRLSRAEFDKGVADRGYRPRYRLYDASDGLSGAAIVNVRAARERNGMLWFVRGGGLTVVDPRMLDAPFHPSKRPVRIDGALADDLQLQGPADALVPAGTRTLQIAYSALELTSPQRLRFRYRLDGFDIGWNDAGTRRQAFYTNLPPRRYRFRVEAQIDGESQVDSATWGFTIQPMFYQTAWFYGASAAVLLLALWGAWRVRLRVVEHEFAMVLGERTRLSREIHDTLLQSLVGLTLQINKVARNVVASPADAAQQLIRMRKQVEAHIRDARTSIWDLRSPMLETRDLPTALQELGERAASENAIAFSSSVVGQQRRVSPKVENHLLRIGQEAITNAVRHARAARIELELRFEDRLLSMRVKDDGHGFVMDQIERRDGHYGLRSMRERALEIGAEFKVSTAQGAGTEILTLVPIGGAESRGQ
jgi:signal transduction histidine kinase/ligand-binding sensor domain-containing protein